MNVSRRLISNRYARPQVQKLVVVEIRRREDWSLSEGRRPDVYPPMRLAGLIGQDG